MKNKIKPSLLYDFIFSISHVSICTRAWEREYPLVDCSSCFCFNRWTI